MDADVEALVEAIESSFGVKFDRGELDNNSHVDDVCDALRSRLGDRTSACCFTSIAFWRLRRAFVDVLNVPRNSITPSTALECVIPEVHRRRTWRALSQAAGFRLPGLEYPEHIGTAIFLAAFILSLALAILCRGGWWSAVVLFTMPIASTSLFYLLRPSAILVPTHSATLGDFTKTVVGLNYGKLVQEFGPSRDRELLEALRYVIADVTDIEPRALAAENPQLIDLVRENDGLRMQV